LGLDADLGEDTTPGEDMTVGSIDVNTFAASRSISAGKPYAANEQSAEPVRVRHEKYGMGVVESEDEETVNVIFEVYGSKSFSKFFNPLEYL
jgi:hypothetical protein